MKSIFNKCQLLTFLPYIIQWDTSNVIDVSFLFSECSSLTSLSDISKLDISNVTNMMGMFYIYTLH